MYSSLDEQNVRQCNVSFFLFVTYTYLSMFFINRFLFMSFFIMVVCYNCMTG